MLLTWSVSESLCKLLALGPKSNPLACGGDGGRLRASDNKRISRSLLLSTFFGSKSLPIKYPLKSGQLSVGNQDSFAASWMTV
jgi:hypothetical protein